MGHLIIVLKKAINLVALVFILFTLISVFFSFYFEDVYRAEVTLTANYDDRMISMNNQGSQLGGLASLAGLSMDNQAGDKVTVALQLLQSNSFLNTFIINNNILKNLLAADSWNEDRNEIIYSHDNFDSDTNEWIDAELLYFKPGQLHPRIVRAFSSRINIERDLNSGIITLSVDHASPGVAKEWANLLVLDINDKVRELDVAEANIAVEYLSKELDSTSLVNIESTFHRLIEQHIQTITMANVRPDYVFSIIDPAIEPDKAVFPNRLLIITLGIFLGIMFGVSLALFIDYVKQDLKRFNRD